MVRLFPFSLSLSPSGMRKSGEGVLIEIYVSSKVDIRPLSFSLSWSFTTISSQGLLLPGRSTCHEGIPFTSRVSCSERVYESRRPTEVSRGGRLPDSIVCTPTILCVSETKTIPPRSRIVWLGDRLLFKTCLIFLVLLTCLFGWTPVTAQLFSSV